MADEEQPINVAPERARQGRVVRGRVLTVLVLSLVLALIAMAILLTYFYSGDVKPLGT